MLETAQQDDISEVSSTHLLIRSEPTPGVRHISGATIYDEALIGGRLVDRYWASDGYIKPEDERILRWPTPELHTFDLEIDGQALDGY